MLLTVPLTLAHANLIVSIWHRHHKPCVGHRFSIGCVDEMGAMHGAAIVGRPVARACPQYEWCEVSRLVTDGKKNICSYLYGACARVAKEMGFSRIQTYILESEPGVSLKASGWIFENVTEGRDWNTPARGGRRTDQPQENKSRWYRAF